MRERYKVDHILSASQNHRRASRTEAANKLLVTALRRVCDKQANRLSNLHEVVSSLSSQVVTTIGLSATQIVFGNLPHTAILVLPPRKFTADNHDTLAKPQKTPRPCRSLPSKNTLQSFKPADCFYKHNVHAKSFKVGDICLFNGD
jgi:hypothetical protein